MEQQANKHKWESDFTVGNMVWVTTKNWKTERLSYKLDYQIAKPYKVFEKISNLYKVKLPDSIKVHPIFSPDKLQKAVNNPLPRQKNKPPLPIQVNSDDKWEVEEILACKLARGMLKYYISWKGYDPDPPTERRCLQLQSYIVVISRLPSISCIYRVPSAIQNRQSSHT